MKKAICFFLLLEFYSVTAQTTYYFDVNFQNGNVLWLRKTELPQNQKSSEAGFSISCLRKNSKNFILGLKLNTSSYHIISDGYFVKNISNTIEFDTTNSKSNELRMGFLDIGFIVGSISEGGTKILRLQAVPYFGYSLHNKRDYLVGLEKINENFKIDNRFRAGVAIELMTNFRTKKKLFPGFGFGMNYQVTSFLDQSKSFNPLTGYIIISICRFK
jgi:hypothetical protein